MSICVQHYMLPCIAKERKDREQTLVHFFPCSSHSKKDPLQPLSTDGGIRCLSFWYFSRSGWMCYRPIYVYYILDMFQLYVRVLFAFANREQLCSWICVNGVGEVRIERLTSIFAAPEVQRLEPDIKPESILLTCPSVVIRWFYMLLSRIYYAYIYIRLYLILRTQLDNPIPRSY